MTSLRNWIDTVLFGYRFVYDDSEEKPERNALHFVAPFAIADNASTKRTTVTMPEVSAAAAGLVPATDGAFKVLTADGAAAPVWAKVGNDNVADDADIECSKLDGEFDAVSISTDAGLTVGTTCAVTGAITGASCTATGNVGGATLTATTSASVGATPATAGAVRLANTATVQARNAGDDGNVEVVSVDGSDDIHVGATANSASSVYVDVATGEAVYFRVNGATALTVTAGKATVNTVDAATVSPASGDLTLGVTAGQKIVGEIDGGAAFEMSENENLANINLAIHARPASWQSLDGGVFFGNRTAAPAGNPAAGAFLWAEGGGLKGRGDAGAIIELVPAGPGNGADLELYSDSQQTTTDPTTTEIITIPTTTDYAYLVMAFVVVIQDDGTDGATYALRTSFRNDGGTLSQIGSDSILADEDGALSSFNFTSAVSGTDIELQVTQSGASGNFRWKALAHVYVNDNTT